MDTNYLADWAFSCQHTIQNVVQSQFPQEAHRWPIIKDFDAEGYIWNEKYLTVILRDKFSGVPTMGEPKILDNPDAPLENPNPDNVEQWQNFLRQNFSVKSQDFVIIFTIKELQTGII